MLRFAYDRRHNDTEVMSVYHQIKNLDATPFGVRCIEELIMLFPEFDFESDLFFESYFEDLKNEAIKASPNHVHQRFHELVMNELPLLLRIVNYFRLIRVVEPRNTKEVLFLGTLANLLERNISTGGGATAFKKRCSFLYHRSIEPAVSEGELLDFTRQMDTVISALRVEIPEDQRLILEGLQEVEAKNNVIHRLYQFFRKQVDRCMNHQGSYKDLRKGMKRMLKKIIRRLYRLQQFTLATPRLFRRALSTVLADVSRLTSEGRGKKGKKKDKTKKIQEQQEPQGQLGADASGSSVSMEQLAVAIAEETVSLKETNSSVNNDVKGEESDNESEEDDSGSESEDEVSEEEGSEDKRVENEDVNEDENEEQEEQEELNPDSLPPPPPSSSGGSTSSKKSPKSPSMKQQFNKGMSLLKRSTEKTMKKAKQDLAKIKI